MVQCAGAGAMAFNSGPQGLSVCRGMCEAARSALSRHRSSFSCAQDNANSDGDSTEMTKPGMKFADRVDRIRRAVGISKILPSHRSPAPSGYPEGTRGARRSSRRALYCKLSEGDKERLRFEHEQDVLADELRFLGVCVVARSHMSNHPSCFGLFFHASSINSSMFGCQESKTAL